MKRAFMAWTICMLLVNGLRPIQAQADHVDSYCLIEEEADAVRQLVDELRNDFRQQFHHSSVYRPLMSVSKDAESLARRLRTSARSTRPICEIKTEILGLAECANELRGLVEEAKFRAARGMDYPIADCTMRMDERISMVLHKTRYMLRLVDTAESASRRSSTYSSGRYPYGNYQDFGYGRGYDRTYTNRNGSGFDNNFGSTDWSRQGWEQMTSAGSPNESPIGVFGRRGNGLELSDDGITVRLGSSSFRIR